MRRRVRGRAAIVRGMRITSEAKNLNVNVKNGGLVFMEGNRGKRRERK